MNDKFNINNNLMDDSTQFLSAANTIFIAQLYQQYLSGAEISANWKSFFDSMSDDDKSQLEYDFFGPKWCKRELEVISTSNSKAGDNAQKADKNTVTDFKPDLAKIKDLFIKYGHLGANLDPIFQKTPLPHNVLHENTSQLKNPSELTALQKLYCQNVGVEIDHITDSTERQWLVNKYESEINTQLSRNEKLKILKTIAEAEFFEQFIHIKFPGMKRFSIEGGESASAVIMQAIESSCQFGITDFIIGMAHRGRLNMLTNIAGKPYKMLFSEFLKTLKIDPELGDISWDVKYHAGYKTTKKFNHQNIDVQIAFNPSHLEAVNPVVMGMAYGINKNPGKSAMPVMIHGDAAMIGQGVVAECFNISGVAHYNSGGALHLAINNQVGFTAESFQSRTSRYCTDIAKIIECPIFHINADDVEACVKIAKIAVEYRQKFKKDFVIDLVCSRKYGHNEGDEPFYTNPVMYTALKNKISTPEIYAANLIKQAVCDDTYLASIKSEYIAKLDAAYNDAKENGEKLKRSLPAEFDGLSYNFSFSPVKTSINEGIAHKLIDTFFTIPSDFTPNERLKKQLQQRYQRIKETGELDWAAGEMLAFASLLSESKGVRITGQDSERGTFSHRHSVLTDSLNGQKYNILSPLKTEKAQYEVCNSPLSEFAVLGFEYGYSLINPSHLTIWEAQFGDFANGASTIFDQFISSAQHKWLLMSGLVMLLPHGFEGQGPEHSSARLERYLQSCAQDNIIVANCTTPANLFHILRRQVCADYRKPLVIMSPKSLLRHKLVTSNIADFTGDSSFKTIIGEVDKISPDKCKTLIITSGKLYYDLLEARREKKLENTTIIRIEQYYPFDSALFETEIAKYKSVNRFVWAQEEPKNMGAWGFIRDHIEESLEKLGISSKLEYVGRPACASPATGFEKIHEKEKNAILAGLDLA